MMALKMHCKISVHCSFEIIAIVLVFPRFCRDDCCHTFISKLHLSVERNSAQYTQSKKHVYDEK